MKLVRAQVQNYRSVEDSGEFEIGGLTCLVGKNEAGKTTLLNALRGIRPAQPFAFDKVTDYPRRFAARFDERHPNGKADVIKTWWVLDQVDIDVVAQRFGAEALSHPSFTAEYGFGYEKRSWSLNVREELCLSHLIRHHALSEAEQSVFVAAMNGAQAGELLASLPERTAAQEAMLQDIRQCRDSSFTLAVHDLLSPRMPKFFFTSHFERMSGEISMEQLQRDRDAGTVKPGDQIFLDFLAYAGTTPEELAAADKRESLKAQCEAAGNDITEEIFQFWSQNNALEVLIDFDAGKPGDPAPFNAGTVAQVRIKNTHHKATLPLSERSAGFVWFFSFLAQFKELKKTNPNAIILLDEPGLTLHGRAQGDLLRYIVERLLPEHQVIFTTHSPFMVPMGRLEDVRIVEDVIEGNGPRPLVKGTKVRSDVLEVTDDTLFPLQGALGYEVSQTLFIAPNTWLVEGPSDIIYLQVLSQALKKRGRQGMSEKWAVCPTGGIDKIAPFISLFGGNLINVAVLSDIGKGEVNKVEKLKKSDILKAGRFFTVADFLDQTEADIEDIFTMELFAYFLNQAYAVPSTHTVTIDTLTAADTTTPRIVKKAEALFRLMPAGVSEFDHFGPARWLLENPDVLDSESDSVLATLVRAEKIFTTYNHMLNQNT